MREERSSPSQKHDEHVQGWARVTEHLDRKQGAADRSNDGVDGVPGGIDPRNFISKKFEQKKYAGDSDDEWITQNGERFIRRSECDPVLMNGEASGEHSQIEVQTGETGQAERNAQKIESLHAPSMSGEVTLV